MVLKLEEKWKKNVLLEEKPSVAKQNSLSQNRIRANAFINLYRKSYPCEMEFLSNHDHGKQEKRKSH